MRPIQAIIQPEKFTWDKFYEEENESILNNQNVLYHYDCYSYKLLKPEGNELTLLQISPRLEVVTSVDVLFIGEFELKYRVLQADIGFADILRYATKSAHSEFIQAFDRRESHSALNRFRPVYSDEIVEKHIEWLLNP